MKQIVKFLIILSLIFVSESCISSAIPSLPKEDDSVFEELTYVAFGDSITFGADYTRNYSQMDNPYPKLVFQQLNLKSYTNYAISGSTIATGVDDLPSIYNQIISSDTKADIISVMGGVNDYNRNVEIGSINDNNTTTFYGSLKAICETLLNKYSTSFCCINLHNFM